MDLLRKELAGAALASIALLCTGCASGAASSSETSTSAGVASGMSQMASASCEAPDMPTSDDWVVRSNQHVSETLFPIIAKYGPEGGAGLGIDGLDEEVFPIGPTIYAESLADFRVAIADLECRLQHETDAKVRQDLQILIQGGHDNIRSSELNYGYSMPYANLTGTVFQGVRGLLDDQIDPARYPAALVRVRKYAGLVDGYTPLVDSARAVYEARIAENPDLSPPFLQQIEQDLERSEQFLAGVAPLFEQYGVEDWQESWSVLEAQLREYNEWVREEILPQGRTEFRLPRELYEDALYNWGVYWTPEELIQRAGLAIRDIHNEMDALAPLVAADRGWEEGMSTYDVVKRLQSEQIAPDQILDAYTDTLRRIEDLLRQNRVISIPERPAGIRIASEAETAQQPAPHLDVPRLIGNTGEFPYFVLPALQPDEDGNIEASDDLAMATTWTLTAHEARPGHEMQFSSMIEGGVSITRVVFAFNSANVEGWALYAEAITKPYMPLDGQLLSLQNRLVRAYRMMLDPMLNLGMTTPERALEVLMEDAMILRPWAENEVERYTYRIPGQATAYYYGYSHIQSMRARVEIALGEDFDQQAFHDFILAQGLLPPDVLERTVMEDFVPEYLSD
jgi:Bacterial protein of unknown function (DUF885)